MASGERRPFGKSILDLGEKSQEILEHFHNVGNAVVSLVAGSSSPNYRQLKWQSKGLRAEVRQTVNIDGDPKSTRLPIPRLWKNAAVIATPQSHISSLKEELGLGQQSRANQAIAFAAGGATRVGVMSEGDLFTNIDDYSSAVAMRLGRGALEKATMGLWLPDEMYFVGVRQLDVVEAIISLEALASVYPNIVVA